MPIHDWRHVEAGIFHYFHLAWIEEIKRALNAGLLPEGYYALAEQHAAGFGPLYVEPNGYVLVPLEATYRRAFAALPRRRQAALQPEG